MSKEYLPDQEKRILLSALSHEMKLVKDNNFTELIPVVKNLDYKFMYDRLFKKIEDNAYQQGRADAKKEINEIMDMDLPISNILFEIDKWLKEQKNE